MPDGSGWLWTAVLRSGLDPRALIDGSVDLAFLADIYDAITIADENERRIREALNPK